MSGSDVNAFTLVLDLEKTLKELGVPARRLPALLNRVLFADGGADAAAELEAALPSGTADRPLQRT
ncbi:hypothetical protein [Streptomyces canus]|uniref:hypothetical protein n=1 Tax=Streptomyces canus TaxID=58343 RepID=UPI0030DE22B4